MKIDTTAQLKEEFQRKAQAAGLQVQCVSDGAFHSEIAVIAEAPGDREVDQKRPLIGGSGSKLWEVLRKFGVNRQQVYVTNVCKRQVSFGDDKRHPINKHELDHWKNLLIWELSQLPNLKYILVLGNMSLEAVCGKNGVSNWRGSVLEVDSILAERRIQALVTYNPAMILREPKLELTFTFDMRKFKQVIGGKWQMKPFNVHINPTKKQALDWMDHLEHSDMRIAYDLETIANETACIGLAGNDVEAMCINFRTIDANRFSVSDERDIRRRFQTLATNAGGRFIAQNNSFDASWLWFKDRIHVPRIWMDTMLGHHVLYPQLPHNLGYLTTQYTTRPYYKDEKDEWREGGDIDSFWIYNGQDCCNTHGVATDIYSELRTQKLDDFFFNYVMFAQPHLIRMTVGGVLVDNQVKGGLKDVIGKDVERLLGEFHEAVHAATGDPDYDPNPKSPKQLSELFFHRLKLVGRGVSTNAENRERMYSHIATTEPKRAVIRAVDEFADAQKFYSTYVTSANDDDGRMRCEYSQIGVQRAPGRLSSKGLLWRNEHNEQTGCNLQNQPERAYEMYIADEGYGLGYFDMAQAEARLVAWMAPIEPWIEQFERARIDGVYDAHRALASDMFSIPYDEVPTFDRYDITKGHVIPEGKRTGDVTLRFVAKRCRHGLNYRMMPDRLSSTTGLPLTVATDAYKRYHRQTPELQRWWTALEEEITRTKTLFNAFGRRFILLERLTPEALEAIVAFKPQSTLGDLVTHVIGQCHEDPRWPLHARIMLNIHDALICIAPIAKLKTCLAIMKEYAEKPIIINGRELIIPADTKMSYADEKGIHRWSQLKAVTL